MPTVFSVEQNLWFRLRSWKSPQKIGVIILGLIAFALPLSAEEGRIAQSTSATPITLEKFIERAVQKDTVFEEILIDQLTLQYQKKLRLPPPDLVVSVRNQYEFFLDRDRDENNWLVSLDKLFPFTGTELGASLRQTPTKTAYRSSSEANFSLTQPIAENAFGKATRLLDKIVGLEVDVASHQIAEAYEDYLATVILVYINWYEAYENLRIGRASYKENQRLLDNMKERQRNQIALPVDVNKTILQVYAKEENLLEIEQTYQNRYNEVRRILRIEEAEALIPDGIPIMRLPSESVDKDIENFQAEGRTYHILRLLEQRSDLEVDREANLLLPSLDLVFTYGIEGEEDGLTNKEDIFSAGIDLEWPLPHTVQRAEVELAKINLAKRKLINENANLDLITRVRNLHQEIERERALVKIAEEKVRLAQSVLKDEAENYTFGKITLNDFIRAVNLLDENRFGQVRHAALVDKFLVEYRRLTDRLIRDTNLEYKLQERK
jgi:outer membrane protein TolC